ncbi:MAG: beta-N-acetylhexosaminidase [Faecalimonas sp.]|nr:beta-N-acetylhexosaminidase [Faecalimonas sp.]
MINKSIFETKMPFERFGLMLDNSRNAVMTVESVKRMIRIMEKLDYNMLMLYTEDTYEVNNQPYFGRYRGRYKKEELKELDAYAKARGIELVPCIQTLAHLFTLQHWPTYWDVADSRDTLCVGEEKVYQLIDDIFATLAECFTSRNANIGMDEAAMLGLGNYLKKHGYRNRIDIFTEHLNRVSQIAKKYGFSVCIWSDMFFKLASAGWHEQESKCDEIDASVSSMIPENVRLIYWDYYSTDKAHYDQWIEGHAKLKPNTLFAGGLWSWSGFAPHNAYSLKSGEAALTSCMEHGVRDVFFTVWGNDGAECSRFSVLPSMFYNSCIAHGIVDEQQIKNKFQTCFGISFDDYMLLDLPDTPDARGEHVNPCKYMFYCDCLMGKFDSNVRKTDAKEYADMSVRLECLTEHAEFGVLFSTMRALCDVLSLKVDIGVRTRAAYVTDDKLAMSRLLDDYDQLKDYIEKFYEAFRTQWFWENKPHGFEVHDSRIGGLILRISHCRKRLADYINGDIDKIEELEEPELDFMGRGELLNEEDKKSFDYNGWYATVTTGVV